MQGFSGNPISWPVHVLLITNTPIKQFRISKKTVDNLRRLWYNTFCPWGYSAVGSASEWHSEGQGFESPYLHVNPYRYPVRIFCCAAEKKGRSLRRPLPFRYSGFQLSVLSVVSYQRGELRMPWAIGWYSSFQRSPVERQQSGPCEKGIVLRWCSAANVL